MISKKYEELIKEAPLSLLALDNNKLFKLHKRFPYSTGIEIECYKNEGITQSIFKSIPNIMEVDCSYDEQRFRLPNGIAGIICLYQLSECLIENCGSNPLSGNHYHIDMTDCFDLIDKEFIKQNSKWILEELDEWKYDGSYNSRKVSHDALTGISDYSTWLKFNSRFKTAEFRIGEMTFNYNLLLKRITHCHEIVLKIKNKLFETYDINIKTTYSNINKDKVLDYLDNYNISEEGNIYTNKDNLDKIQDEVNNKIIDINDLL